MLHLTWPHRRPATTSGWVQAEAGCSAARGRQLSLQAYLVLAAAGGLTLATARWSWLRAHACRGRSHLQLCTPALLTLAAVHSSLLELGVLPAQLQQGGVLRASDCQSLDLGGTQVGARLSSLHTQCSR